MQIVLKAYLQVLEVSRPLHYRSQNGAVTSKSCLIGCRPMYAGALGDSAVVRYAMLLISLELSAESSEYRLALTRANFLISECPPPAVCPFEPCFPAHGHKLPKTTTKDIPLWFCCSRPSCFTYNRNFNHPHSHYGSTYRSNASTSRHFSSSIATIQATPASITTANLATTI